jgi:phosphate transport system substrate-binding protein
MSREMKDDEIEAFEGKYGYKPTAIPVAVDALAVLVNKDNPIKGLTTEQVDSIFSSTNKCGGAKSIESWGDAGVAAWGAKSIQLYGRNSVSGTYGYFKEHALCKGDFKSNVNEQPGSASVVQSVTESVNGIGYSGMGYSTSGIKMVPLAKKGSTTFVEATPENALNGSYPLTRYLFIYVNKKPNSPLPPLEQEFIKMVLSKAGQQSVIKDGYIPLPAKIVEKALAAVK